MTRRFPLAARLTIILGGVALLTLAVAALLQDRALSRGLSAAATDRLDASARATERLLADHLREQLLRYEAVSRTPELRAHLELKHRPTLERMAASLAKQSGATQLLLLDPAWKVRARYAADDEDDLRATWNALRVDVTGARACVASDAAGFRPCSFAQQLGPQATLRLDGERTQALVLVPLRTGKRLVGMLAIGEPLEAALFDGWSELVGARVSAVGPEAASGDALMRVAHRFPGLELRVSSSLAPELATLADTRAKIALAGVVALGIAFALSAFVARDFLRPIREIRRATERVGRGDLDVRLHSDRRDEIGDVARVLDDTLDRLGRSQQRLRNVQRIAHFGDWSADLARDIVEGSPEFESVLGLPARWSGTLGAFLRCFGSEERARLDERIARCGRLGTPIDLDLRSAPRPEGERVLHVRARRVGDAGDEVRIEGSVQDVTDRRRAEEQIRFLAFHDSLTGLPNRRFLSERLALALAPGQPQGFSVLFLDLDRFKLVNDTLGHSAGDQLLCRVAERLGTALAGEPGAAVARFGGDEFTILLPGIDDDAKLVAVAQDLLHAVAAPVDLDGQQMVITASIGIARWPADGDSIEALLRSCDTALHRAKHEGRNGHAFYDASMEQEASQRWKLENRLRRAVESMEFEVYYQPRMHSSDGSLAGFEALLRWNDASFGGYRPDEFIPIAEETGLIVPLGSWVLRTVLHQIRSWLDEGLKVPCVSVNLSGRQLTRDLVTIVRDALEGADVDPSLLEVEVTESAVIADAEMGIAVLGELRDLGVRLSLDDFGTGYSSLSYLRTLPISGVKIDRSFVRSLGRDERDTALVGSIVSMAKVLGLFVIAEGVETEEQAELLAEMGCDELQGFLFGEATPDDEARRRLVERRRRKRDAPI